MKKCFKCGAEKPYTEFYKHKQMADGHIGKCKDCTKNDVRRNRADKVEYYRQYDVKRYQSDPSVRKRINSSSRRWREKNPDKYKAHNAVSNAIRDGKLRKSSCEVCGAKYVHGHHDDYNKPLEVRWLCAVHHREHHDQQA